MRIQEESRTRPTVPITADFDADARKQAANPNDTVHLHYNLYFLACFFSQNIVLSHNKSANSVFQPAYQLSRTDQRRYKATCTGIHYWIRYTGWRKKNTAAASCTICAKQKRVFPSAICGVRGGFPVKQRGGSLVKHCVGEKGEREKLQLWVPLHNPQIQRIKNIITHKLKH
jgi:hypothetical protein